MDQVAAFDATGFLEALKSHSGCLGVEVVASPSGRQIIFAWFEDKKAVLDWYCSAAHVSAMERITGVSAPSATPLARVLDDAGPILGIASLRFGLTDGKPSSIQDMSVEMYEAMTPGMAMGATFAPAAVADLVRQKQARAG